MRVHRTRPGIAACFITKKRAHPSYLYVRTVRGALFSLQEGLAINGLKNKSQGGGDFTNLKKNQIAFMDIKYHEGLFTYFSAKKCILKSTRPKSELDSELEYLLVACEDGQIYLWGFETGNYDDLFTTS